MWSKCSENRTIKIWNLTWFRFGCWLSVVSWLFSLLFLFLSPWTCPSAMGIGSSPVYQNSNLSTWFWFSGSGRGCGAAKSGEWSRCSGKIVFVWAKKFKPKKLRFQCILSWHEMGRTAVLIVSSECSPSGSTVCYCTSQLCQSYLRGRIHSAQPDESLKKIK